MSRAGQTTNDRRDEMLLLTDVLGSESLIDSIGQVLANDSSTAPTALGPFWRSNAPQRQMGETIVDGIENGEHVFFYGVVTDSRTGEPISNAELDVWEAARKRKI